MKVYEILSAAEARLGGYLTEEEILSALLEFEAIETGNEDLTLSLDSSLSIPGPFKEIYLYYLKGKAEIKASELEFYQNTQMQFLSLYSDYKRGKMRRSGVKRQDLKYY